MTERQASAKTRPFSIRLTEAERAFIEKRAGTTPLPTYVREILLGRAAETRRVRQTPLADCKPLAHALAVLGKSGLATSLQSLALMAATGVLYVDGETEAFLRRSCEDVREIRDLLLQALGKEPPEHPSAEDAFSEAVEMFSRTKGHGGRP